MAILGVDFLRAHNLMVDPANCRLVQAGGCVYPTTAVTSGPTASVITGVSSPISRPASAAADVKLPSRLPAAALSVGRETSSSTPDPVALQQAGLTSAVSAACVRSASSAAELKPPSGLSAARVVGCRLECRQSSIIYPTRSCCISAGGHFFSGHGRRPAERRFCGQPHFDWQTSPVFAAPSPAFRGCGEPF